jgi:hypothetical protein
MQGAPLPRLVFGIGHSVVRTVKGILVTVDNDVGTGQPSLVTHPVSIVVAKQPQ